MRRADIDIYQGLPSVNVKTDPYNWQRFATQIGPELGYPGFSAEWCEEHVSEAMEQSYWESACESGWENAQTDAEELFPEFSVVVESRGRSGGHLVVTGLPDVESWDAVMVARWAKFAKWMRDAAEAIPEVMAELVCINAFDQWEQAQARKQAQCAAARLPVLLTV